MRKWGRIYFCNGVPGPVNCQGATVPAGCVLSDRVDNRKQKHVSWAIKLDAESGNGMACRESVAGFSRNQWQVSAGIGRPSLLPLIIPYPLYESQVVMKGIIQTSVAGPEFHIFAFGKRNINAVV